MRFSRQILFIVIALSIICTGSGFQSRSMAANRLYDIHSIINDNNVGFSFELSEKPKFFLEPVDDKNLSLSIKEIKKPKELSQKIDNTPLISIEDTEKLNDSLFNIRLKKPFEKINCAWVEDKNILYINIELSKERERNKPIREELAVLRDIRFGFKEKAVRMVIGSDKNPMWKILANSRDKISLIIKSSPEILKNRTFNTGKWLDNVSTKGNGDNETDISLKLKSELNQISIFWMDVGSRLVMDLFNSPEDKLIKSAFLKGHPEISGKNKDYVEVGKENGEFNTKIRMKIAKNYSPTYDQKKGKQDTKSITNDNPLNITPTKNQTSNNE